MKTILLVAMIFISTSVMAGEVYLFWDPLSEANLKFRAEVLAEYNQNSPVIEINEISMMDPVPQWVIDATYNQKLSKRIRVHDAPVIIYWEDGREKDRISGKHAMDKLGFTSTMKTWAGW